MADIKAVGKKLQEMGYSPTIDSEMQAYQEAWRNWYQGFVPNFHEFTAYAGTDAKQSRKRFSLGMAKVISELWADYMYNPETEVKIEDEAIQEWWDNKDHDIAFSSNMNNFMEQVFALGTGATVQYKDGLANTNVDYIRYDMIIPLETLNNDILSCAFVSEYNEDTIYINIHERQVDGKYVIYNTYCKVDNNDELQEIETLDGVAEAFTSPVKLFQIHKPAIVNNKVLGSPYGVSIFGNAEDELKASDIAFDALTKEVDHGKIRIYLREGALEIGIDGNEKTQTFSKSEEFYLLKGDDVDQDGQLITVSTPQLREVLIDFLDTHLNVLGRKCGLGNEAFSNKDGTIYTNTAQVISTNSRFFATRQKHGTLMIENIINLVKGLYWLEFGKELEKPISVHMDDSIIHDKEEETKRMLSLNLQGKISDEYLFETIFDYTEEQAIAFVKRQRELMGLEEDIELEE